MQPGKGGKKGGQNQVQITVVPKDQPTPALEQVNECGCEIIQAVKGIAKSGKTLLKDTIYNIFYSEQATSNPPAAVFTPD